MQSERILVIDDDNDVLALIKLTLAREGFQVSCLSQGSACLRSAKENSPDLILLDLMLPEKDGFEILKELKSDPGTREIPSIILSARSETEDIVRALEMGADDYIIKPFNKSILIARARSVLRRRMGEAQDARDVIKLEALHIDPVRHEVRINADVVELTAGEFNLLHFLARRRGAVFTRKQIIKTLHGGNYDVTNCSVDVQLVGIRKKLGIYGKIS